ncbi:MAG: ParB N-terminal domain-containing protein [Clostridia bacterium]|nr:ParB N-terminal domain-containing protein [Clostridia bacterium]
MSRKLPTAQETAFEEYIDPERVQTVNGVTDRKKYDALVSSFTRNGWDGRPLVVVENGNEGYIALTGSHRIAAAREARINVPAIVLDNTEETARLIDAYRDDEREEIAKELAEEGVIPKRAYYLLAQENELNYADEPQYSRTTRRHGLTDEQIAAIQSIGQNGTKDYTSVNDFTSEDIKKLEPLARQYRKDMGANYIKSPFFRAWFGDWRVNDKTPVVVADKKGDVRGANKNDDTGWDINVSRQVFNETNTHNNTISKKARPYLSYINDIVKKAILLDTYTIPKEERKSPNSLLMHSFYAVADIGNGSEIVKLYVEEMNDVNQDITAKRAYKLLNIEISSSKVEGSQKNVSPINRTADIKTVADLFNAVKSRDKSFKPNPASKVVNEDGTPKVVYHGTNENFTVFDASKGRANMDIQGMFFSPWEIEAGGYGENVRAFYLNIKKPASEAQAYKALNAHKGENNAGKKARDDLIAMGYDGVNVSDEEYIAFFPEQIKSATDNIGTFDPSNPDIRYSRKGQDSLMRDYKRLARENARLKEEFRRTKGIRLDERDIRKPARGIIKDYDIIDMDAIPPIQKLPSKIIDGLPRV